VQYGGGPVPVVYAREPFPERVERTLFLAGPTPRDAAVPSWRPLALALLEAKGWDGHVFVPEDASGSVRGDYDDQIEWELTGLRRADCVLFWVPRDLGTMPAFTTNVEFGLFASSGRAVLGAPPDAPKLRYLRELAARHHVPSLDSLEAAVDAAIATAGPSAPRSGGECCVPAAVFRSPAFRAWYGAQRSAGNELRSARVEWVLRTGPQRDWLFLWALRVELWVRAEGRLKRNEVVLGRPDASQVVLLCRDASDPLASRVALVREFRSAASTPDGFVREPPGGSTFEGDADPREVALGELAEEAGLCLPLERLTPLGARQLAPTLLSHRAHAFVVELRPEELAGLLAAADRPKGAGGSEITWLEVRTAREWLHDPAVDWSSLGMVARALFGERT
jgi:8-oxo-dGTP pyrophosphatase MutT (NUDIX family)